mmetsp:Transcript_2882/g.7919  ORF Transcript_2882/g.7919 Transcript_2882/m.7919 type:complete len:113 (-) Transcript_2882:1883-2221(-)
MCNPIVFNDVWLRKESEYTIHEITNCFWSSCWYVFGPNASDNLQRWQGRMVVKKDESIDSFIVVFDRLFRTRAKMAYLRVHFPCVIFLDCERSNRIGIDDNSLFASFIFRTN